MGVSVIEGFQWRVVLEKMNNTPVYEANGARVRNFRRCHLEFISAKMNLLEFQTSGKIFWM